MNKRPLPDYMQRALRTGERTWAGNGYSRNHLVFSIGMSAFQNGWSKEDFIDAILNPVNLAGEKFQDMPEPKARKKLGEDWNRIGDFVADNPPQGGADIVRKRLESAVRVVQSMKWSGRTGNTDRHVLLTILALSHEVGTYTPAFSTRTLAMAANKTTNTIMASLTRLRESGYLDIITPATPTKSPVYEVTISSVHIETLNSESGSDSCVSVKTETMGHDIFTRGALGETALRLWTQLEYGKPYTAKQMSEILGLGEDVCRRAAHKLVEVGMADSDSGRPMTFTFYDESDGDPGMLDMLLMELETWAMPDTSDLSGTSGKGEKRSEKYERERAARKLEFAHYDQLTDSFVDPTTGEVLDTSTLIPLNGSESLPEALSDSHHGSDWGWFDRALEAS